MEKRKVEVFTNRFNLMRWPILAIGVVALTFMFISPAFAEMDEITIGVDGLSCPFCVMGLEKNLKKVDSVDSVKVHLKKAEAEVSLKAGSSLDLNALHKAVRDAGFSWRELRIKVAGTIVREEGFIALESEADKTRFILYDQNHIDAEIDSATPQVLNADLQGRFLKAEGGKRVIIQGTIHEHANMAPGLLVEEVEINP